MKGERIIVLNHVTLNLDKELKLNYPAHWGELWCGRQSNKHILHLNLPKLRKTNLHSYVLYISTPQLSDGHTTE